MTGPEKGLLLVYTNIVLNQDTSLSQSLAVAEVALKDNVSHVVPKSP
jgi:hypothetical protein